MMEASLNLHGLFEASRPPTFGPFMNKLLDFLKEGPPNQKKNNNHGPGVHR